MASWGPHLNTMCFLPVELQLEEEDSARWLIENLNPSSVVNAENIDLAKLPKDLLATSLILIILIMNLEIA